MCGWWSILTNGICHQINSEGLKLSGTITIHISHLSHIIWTIANEIPFINDYFLKDSRISSKLPVSVSGLTTGFAQNLHYRYARAVGSSGAERRPRPTARRTWRLISKSIYRKHRKQWWKTNSNAILYTNLLIDWFIGE